MKNIITSNSPNWHHYFRNLSWFLKYSPTFSNHSTSHEKISGYFLKQALCPTQRLHHRPSLILPFLPSSRIQEATPLPEPPAHGEDRKPHCPGRRRWREPSVIWKRHATQGIWWLWHLGTLGQLPGERALPCRLCQRPPVTTDLPLFPQELPSNFTSRVSCLSGKDLMG